MSRHGARYTEDSMVKNIIIVFLLAAIATGAYLYFTQEKPAQTSQTSESARIIPGSEAERSDVSDTPQNAQGSFLTGTWKSTTDPKFTREIRADFVIIDRYEGDATAGLNGEWAVVDPSVINIPGVSAASLSGETLIQATWEGGVEVTFFVVTELTPERMTVRDLTGNGEVTTFTKVR